MVDVVELIEVSRKVADADPVSGSDSSLCEVAVGLEQARAAIDAASLRVLAELDSRKVTDTRTGLSTGTWLARQAHGSTVGSKARVAAARKVATSLPGVTDALAAGKITYDHVRVLHRACRPRIADAITELVDELIDLAQGMVFEPWRTQVEAIVDLLDADGNFDPNDDLDRNQLSISATIDGITKLDGTLTGEHAIVVTELINNKADELFHRFKTDHDNCTELQIPSRRTLMALALVELVRAGAAIDLASSRPPRTEANLIIPAGHPTHPEPDDPPEPGDPAPVGAPKPFPKPGDHAEPAEPSPGTAFAHPQDHHRSSPPPSQRPHRPTPQRDATGREPPDWRNPFNLPPASKLGRLLDRAPRVTTRHGTLVQDGTYRLFACDATYLPVVVDNLGIPLDMGRAVRFATDTQRRAIAIRDGGCIYPGCPLLVNWCDIRHVHHWHNGGTTDLNLLCALCRHHHGVIHRDRWTIQPIDAGYFLITSPTGDTLPSQRHHRLNPQTASSHLEPGLRRRSVAGR